MYPSRVSNGFKYGDLLMSYKSIFQDVRGSVDYLHMKGDLKKKTCEGMSKYVHRDENLPVLIRRIQAAGRKTFLGCYVSLSHLSIKALVTLRCKIDGFYTVV